MEPDKRRGDNPWGLTRYQEQVMDILPEAGWTKVAAQRLGVSEWSIRCAVKAARKKMGSRGMYGHILLWDRWRRQEQA